MKTLDDLFMHPVTGAVLIGLWLGLAADRAARGDWGIIGLSVAVFGLTALFVTGRIVLRRE